jgi:glutamate/aspartate transport system substrate-binding protein
MHSLRKKSLSLVTLLSFLVCTAPHALELTGTLKKIKEKNAIVIGHRESSIPFSYLDQHQQPVGYSMDLCLKVVEAMKKELQLPNLKIEYSAVTAQARIPLIKTGAIDLECGATTNNTERQKLAGFSVVTYVAATKLLVKKASGIHRLEDLKGKTVALPQGTTNERVIRKLSDEKKLGLNYIYAQDAVQGLLNVTTGHASAFVSDDVLLAGLAANAKNPEELAVVGEALSLEPYGIMFRKDDFPLKKIVDQTLMGLMKSGEIKTLYSKWFTSPIPPKNANLKLPLSSALEAKFKMPSDQPAN